MTTINLNHNNNMTIIKNSHENDDDITNDQKKDNLFNSLLYFMLFILFSFASFRHNSRDIVFISLFCFWVQTFR